MGGSTGDGVKGVSEEGGETWGSGASNPGEGGERDGIEEVGDSEMIGSDIGGGKGGDTGEKKLPSSHDGSPSVIKRTRLTILGGLLAVWTSFLIFEKEGMEVGGRRRNLG